MISWIKQFVCVPLVLFLFGNKLFSQTNVPDSSKRKTIAYSWRSTALRLGVGIQKAYYTELGFSYVFHQFDSRFGSGNGIVYTSWEWLPEEKINGVKLGAETCSQLGALGLEIKYQFSDKVDDLVVTPKIGVGVGFLNLFYGYNLSLNKTPFRYVGHHQFSLVFNITRKYFKNYHSAPMH